MIVVSYPYHSSALYQTGDIYSEYPVPLFLRWRCDRTPGASPGALGPPELDNTQWPKLDAGSDRMVCSPLVALCKATPDAMTDVGLAAGRGAAQPPLRIFLYGESRMKYANMRLNGSSVRG